jgi:hypothetical protein
MSVHCAIGFGVFIVIGEYYRECVIAIDMDITISQFLNGEVPF